MEWNKRKIFFEKINSFAADKRKCERKRKINNIKTKIFFLVLKTLEIDVRFWFSPSN